MEKIISILKKTGVGFVTGNYRSFFGFEVIKNNINMVMSINFSVNNKYIGKYQFLIKKIDNNEVSGMLCDKAGNYTLKLEKRDNFHLKDNYISITLNPFNIIDDTGTFIARGPWRKPFTH